MNVCSPGADAHVQSGLDGTGSAALDFPVAQFARIGREEHRRTKRGSGMMDAAGRGGIEVGCWCWIRVSTGRRNRRNGQAVNKSKERGGAEDQRATRLDLGRGQKQAFTVGRPCAERCAQFKVSAASCSRPREPA
jgi:hypothetical protein